MEDPAIRIEFLLTALIVVASPGTGVLYTLAAGLGRGRRSAIVAAFGCTLGIVPHLLAATLGLAAVLHQSALAFQTLKYAGVAYLLYMAWRTLRDTGVLTVPETIGARSDRDVVATAILVNLLNPKLSIFFLAFLPQFIDGGDGRSLRPMLELGGVFMAMTFVVFTGYGLFAAAVRHHVVGRPAVATWMRRLFAGAFAALGLKLAVTQS